jgi:branched-chain amino acid transport system substrate-binding protein
MTETFGDDQLERELMAALHDRAEEIAGRARTAAEMTAVIAPRLTMAARARHGETFLRLIAVALVVLLLVIGAILFGARPSRPPIHLLFAMSLPLAGEPAAPPMIDAVRLAIRDAHLPAGVSVDLPPDGIFDDAVDGVATPEQGAVNMRAIAGDPRFVAAIGPFHSYVATAAIPIANEAGLLQCSATNTSPGLTIGDEAASLRPRPDRPSYVRLATPDDTVTTAAARLIVGVLDKRKLFVVTTVEPFAGGRVEQVVEAVEAAGGEIAGRGWIGDGGDEPAVVADQVLASAADAVMFDGLGIDGGRVLEALSAAGSKLPFVGLDIILDGPRSADGSFLHVAGDVGNAYGVFQAGRDPTLGPEVETRYQQAFGRAPEDFILSGYSCASVILEAINGLQADSLVNPSDWREALRAAVTATGRQYSTPVGTITFDANGDAVPRRVSIYRADPEAGDWAFWQLLELAPDP